MSSTINISLPTKFLKSLAKTIFHFEFILGRKIGERAAIDESLRHRSSSHKASTNLNLSLCKSFLWSSTLPTQLAFIGFFFHFQNLLLCTYSFHFDCSTLTILVAFFIFTSSLLNSSTSAHLLESIYVILCYHI